MVSVDGWEVGDREVKRNEFFRKVKELKRMEKE